MVLNICDFLMLIPSTNGQLRRSSAIKKKKVSFCSSSSKTVETHQPPSLLNSLFQTLWFEMDSEDLPQLLFQCPSFLLSYRHGFFNMVLATWMSLLEQMTRRTRKTRRPPEVLSDLNYSVLL